MAIKYTYYDYKCPHCGKTYKTTFWDLYKVLIVPLTAGFALSWFLAIAIIRAVFGSSDMPNVGDASRICKNCGKRFMSYEHDEWQTLDKSSKKKWSYRLYLRVLYAIGGCIPILLLLQFLWTSKYESDHTIALVLLIFAILFICIIVCGYYAWKKYEQTSEIVLSQDDFDTVMQSLRRTESDVNKEDPPIRISGTTTVYGVKSDGTKATLAAISENKPTVVSDKITTPVCPDYGYSQENPILLSSILEEYPYISSLETCTANKIITGIEKKAAIIDNRETPLDVWEISLTDYNSHAKETVKLYINAYAESNNRTVSPKGFRFK